MIIDTLINILLFPLKTFISTLDVPFENFVVPSEDIDFLKDFLAVICWVFPVAKLMPILVISTALNTFRVVWAIIIRIKSFIPFMGA